MAVEKSFDQLIEELHRHPVVFNAREKSRKDFLTIIKTAGELNLMNDINRKRIQLHAYQVSRHDEVSYYGNNFRLKDYLILAEQQKHKNFAVDTKHPPVDFEDFLADRAVEVIENVNEFTSNRVNTPSNRNYLEGRVVGDMVDLLSEASEGQWKRFGIILESGKYNKIIIREELQRLEKIRFHIFINMGHRKTNRYLDEEVK